MEQENARAFILNQFVEQGDFSFLPEGMLPEMVQKLIDLDQAFMARTKVDEGEPYDDDAAYDELFAAMQAAYPDYKMYAMRLVEDYLDYNEEYLDSIGAIDWE